MPESKDQDRQGRPRPSPTNELGFCKGDRNCRGLRRFMVMSVGRFRNLSAESDHFKQRLIDVLEDILSA